MRDKNGKEATVTRWVDDQGQQQIVILSFSYIKYIFFLFILITGYESW
jgi:hypothetical protein